MKLSESNVKISSRFVKVVLFIFHSDIFVASCETGGTKSKSGGAIAPPVSTYDRYCHHLMSNETQLAASFIRQ